MSTYKPYIQTESGPSYVSTTTNSEYVTAESKPPPYILYLRSGATLTFSTGTPIVSGVNKPPPYTRHSFKLPLYVVGKEGEALTDTESNELGYVSCEKDEGHPYVEQESEGGANYVWAD